MRCRIFLFVLVILLLIGGHWILFVIQNSPDNILLNDVSIRNSMSKLLYSRDQDKQTLPTTNPYPRNETRTLKVTNNNRSIKGVVPLKWFPYKILRDPPGEDLINLNISGVDNIFLFLVPYGKSYTKGLNRRIHGIGNRLFAIAATLGIAKQNNRTAILDNSALDLRQWFPNITKRLTIGIPNTTNWEGLDYWKYWETPFYNEKLFYQLPTRKNLEAYGCPFSYKYFNNIVPDIRQRFKLSSNLTRKVSDFLDTSPALGGLSCLKIGVHIRRGDKAANRRM